MEAIQTRKERICGLEVVLNRDTTSGGGTPNREVQLALPPIERSGFPGIPSLVCHSDIPGECRVLVLGEDVWERGLKVTSPIINHNLLVGVVGWCEGVMYLVSPGRPTDIGLQLGKACYR